VVTLVVSQKVLQHTLWGVRMLELQPPGRPRGVYLVLPEQFVLLSPRALTVSPCFGQAQSRQVTRQVAQQAHSLYVLSFLE
jgi:hypothetical protein